MKAVILLALVAFAAALPTPEAEPEADPATLLYSYGTYPYIHTPVVKVKTAGTAPLVYSGVPLSYHAGLPLAYPFGYHPFVPLVTKPAEEAAAVESA